MSRSSKLVTERYDLPDSTDGVCALVREVLNRGNVSRLEMDSGDTFVRVRRWVEDDGLSEDEVTWDAALRHVPSMVEYYSDGATSFQVVVDMMLLAQREGAAVAWVTGIEEENLLRHWFEIGTRAMPVGDIDFLLGLPIHRVKSIPEETLILCCARWQGADPEEITVAIKTTIQLRSEDGTVAIDKDADRGGDHPQEHVAAADQLALTTGGLREVPWDPSAEP